MKSSSWSRFASAAAALAVAWALGSLGCGSASGGGANPSTGLPPADGGGGSGGSAGAGGGGGGGGTDAGGWPGPNNVCFLLSCTQDAECTGCSLGRHKCDTATSHCVACGAGLSCPSGQQCTQYGTCAPGNASCPAGCAKDTDCAACDTLHQACDATSHTCQQCSLTDQSACLPNEFCAQGGTCKEKCPAQCTSDAECTGCGSANGAAHACNATLGKCAECSSTLPCPNNQVCSPQGICIDACGVAGKPKGSCLVNDDCKGCGQGATECVTPINGGIGKCSVPASGCSDLGNGALTLPWPVDKVTQTCSTQQDCQNAGIELNVGKLLRDITGVDGIGDATIPYEMNACAEVTILNGVSCGVCVPCQGDADCKPIDIDQIASQLFGALGGVAEKWILTEIFGTSNHDIYTYCKPVAGDYGVCVPCSNIGQACGVNQTQGQGCSNDYECTWGEICKSGQCTKLDTNCTFDSECTSGQVCAWSGKGNCCRPPGPAAATTCFSDLDCTTAGEVCSWNGLHFYCMPPFCSP